ncbi:MAG TPA: NADH-quinone oxidoreductase subunit NuoK [Planctomycetes bacterium]|nr:NADH-quinone oxidoreductase subunit NuoK [Planctomycetota bacterium]
MNVPTEHLLALASILFALGVAGFLVRRNVIIVLASVELMLNAANLCFLAGSRAWAAEGAAGGHPIQGPVFALFVILVAAAEAAIGLALIIAIYRLKRTTALDATRDLEG